VEGRGASNAPGGVKQTFGRQLKSARFPVLPHRGEQQSLLRSPECCEQSGVAVGADPGRHGVRRHVEQVVGVGQNAFVRAGQTGGPFHGIDEQFRVGGVLQGADAQVAHANSGEVVGGIGRLVQLAEVMSGSEPVAGLLGGSGFGAMPAQAGRDVVEAAQEDQVGGGRTSFRLTIRTTLRSIRARWLRSGLSAVSVSGGGESVQGTIHCPVAASQE
jgi:hypothetical protein